MHGARLEQRADLVQRREELDDLEVRVLAHDVELIGHIFHVTYSTVDRELPALIANATRVPGTAVFLVSNADYAPTAMLRNLQHNHVVHETSVILHVEIARQPRIDPLARTRIDSARLSELQRALVRSHSAGTGALLDDAGGDRPAPPRGGRAHAGPA